MLHHNLVTESLKQSEHDMPRMSWRNGVTDGTKMTASERVRNMFMLLCVMHTKDGRGIFRNGLNELDIALSAFKNCMKLQLSFEKWVDDSNLIIDVCGASDLLSKLIRSIKKKFQELMATVGIYQRCIHRQRCFIICNNLAVLTTFQDKLENVT